jgi:hypothetical protein
MMLQTRNRWWVLLLAVVLVLTVSVALAQDNDDFEPQFPQLIDNTIITGTFEADVNAHLYAFQGSSGDWINIEMIQRPDGSPLDPYLVLLGPYGEVLLSDDDSGEVLLAAQIERHQLPQDGAYMVLATSARGLRFGADEETFDNDDTLTYDIVLRGASLPLADEPVEFFFNPVEVGTSSIVTIDQSQPVHLTKFEAEAGQVVTITTTEAAGEPDIDTLLYLFDAEGRRLAVNDDADFAAGNLYAEIENFEIPEDGVYLVMAMSFDFDLAHRSDWDSGGTFVLSIEES